jgi:hypothetical protein
MQENQFDTIYHDFLLVVRCGREYSESTASNCSMLTSFQLMAVSLRIYAQHASETFPRDAPRVAALIERERAYGLSG